MFFFFSHLPIYTHLDGKKLKTFSISTTTKHKYFLEVQKQHLRTMATKSSTAKYTHKVYVHSCRTKYNRDFLLYRNVCVRFKAFAHQDVLRWPKPNGQCREKRLQSANERSATRRANAAKSWFEKALVSR